MCDTVMWLKEAGPEPFRCTLPAGHPSPRHPLVQESTGKRREIVEPYCSPSRRMTLTYQTPI
jgi:hypothetical protein